MLRPLLAALAFLSIAVPASAHPHPAASGQSAGRALAAQLRTHRLIAIGEHHGSARSHAFIQSLLRDPAFICSIDDVVVEFGNAGLQDIADRFVSGKPVAREEKVRMWRDTGQWLVWDSPVYEQVFDTVREINLRRLCPRPIRILLGDPAIDWANVHSADDYRRFAERDLTFADVVEREVLAKGRRALLIIGAAHILKGHPSEFQGSLSAAEMIERRHPGALFSLLTLDDVRAAERFHVPRDRLAAVRDTGLAGRSYGLLTSDKQSMRVTVNGETVWRPVNSLTWPAVEKVVDGLILLDSEDHAVPAPPGTYRDPAYQAELRRRAPILAEVYGFDFLPELEALVRAEEAAQPQ